MLVDDTDNGFCLFSLMNGGLAQKYSQRGIVMQKRVPKEATFAENDSVIVGGSSHANVYIWNRNSGTLLQEIKHPDGGLVQAIAVKKKSNCLPAHL